MRSDRLPHEIPERGNAIRLEADCLRQTPRMSEEPAQVLLEARDAYAPRVLRRGGGPLWEMYVASGFADRVVELPVSEADLGVLRADGERYWFLFAALHHPYQLTQTYLDDAELARWCQAILHAPRAQTESFLTRLDHGRANGAISNLLRIFVDADTARLRDGHWFGSLTARRS